MGNPLVDQGVLNRILGSVVWTNFPGLNVTASFLGAEGINFRRTTPATTQHRTMTGVVQSPEPTMEVELYIALLKTQSLSQDYEAQMVANSVLGPGVVYPDVSTGLAQMQLQNMAIRDIGELLFNGSTPLYGVTCSGFYVVNNDLWN